MRCFSHYKDDRICDMCEISGECVSKTEDLKENFPENLFNLHEYCKYKNLRGGKGYAIYWTCTHKTIKKLKKSSTFSGYYCEPDEKCGKIILKELRIIKLEKINFIQKI